MHKIRPFSFDFPFFFKSAPLGRERLKNPVFRVMLLCFIVSIFAGMSLFYLQHPAKSANKLVCSPVSSLCREVMASTCPIEASLRLKDDSEKWSISPLICPDGLSGLTQTTLLKDQLKKKPKFFRYWLTGVGFCPTFKSIPQLFRVGFGFKDCFLPVSLSKELLTVYHKNLKCQGKNYEPGNTHPYPYL